MGVLNLTPDSFWEDSRVGGPEQALDRALGMEEEGADILDLGGESTRPGADEVTAEEECRRVVPAIERIRPRVRAAISVDTRRAAVALRALEAGADLVNDVSAGGDDPGLFEAVARGGGGIVLMHMQGTPRTMQRDPRYGDVVAEVLAALAGARDRALAAGIAPDGVVTDPGIGFGKNLSHNLALLAALPEFHHLGAPVLLGASRKSFLGLLTGRPVGERLAGALAAGAAAALAGAHIVRAHDVGPTVDAVRVADAIREAEA